ncbi:DUF3995 domain-containing protein [Seleniivibrio sp.]|uniref:DUF3995 domain-containing protein n=1 Tax=Seleniivibrio sp. TaxID=2898801 RepID=UPI0025EAE2A8|nr:DUF3995 domain-containing protein [Seleniivibrio sp.]MCD8553229.1 DUF3995 domain-containing protein [Seleniivibrio sp.]
MKLFIIIGSFLMLVVALVHIYWSLGGTLFIDRALPEKTDGRKLFKPTRAGTAIVGTVLLVVAMAATSPLYISDARLLSIFRIVLMFFCVVFFVRFIGDFRFVGIFRKIRNTGFAEYDTLVYTPLSLVFSLVCGLSAYFFNSLA